MYNRQRDPIEQCTFLYEFNYGDVVSKETEKVALKHYDQQIRAAENFLAYLDQLERQNDSVREIDYPQSYEDVQVALSREVLDGTSMEVLIRSHNEAIYDAEKVARKKQQMEQSILVNKQDIEKEKKTFKDNYARMAEIASKLDPVQFATLKITDPSLSLHFRKVCLWILDLFYDSPESTFDWENFKKEVCLGDKGADWIARIKGVNISRCGESQIEQCKYITTTIPMFQKLVNNAALITVLQLAEPILKQIENKNLYTKKKHENTEYSNAINHAIVDLERYKHARLTSDAHVTTLMELSGQEDILRTANLSDFSFGNKGEHLFYKGSKSRIHSFLRGGAIARFNKEQQAKVKVKNEHD